MCEPRNYKSLYLCGNQKIQIHGDLAVTFYRTECMSYFVIDQVPVFTEKLTNPTKHAAISKNGSNSNFSRQWHAKVKNAFNIVRDRAEPNKEIFFSNLDLMFQLSALVFFVEQIIDCHIKSWDHFLGVRNQLTIKFFMVRLQV